MTRICCQQLEPRVGDAEYNRGLSIAAIEQAAAGAAQVVVLPELVSSGYMFQSREEAHAAAIVPDGPLIGEWCALAARHELVIAAGFCEAAGGGPYNSAALIDPTGLRAVYRKLHLWDREKLWFTPGDALPPVIDTAVGRVSLMICYDLEFPELTRTVALAGAELLLVPTNWPLMDTPAGERPGEVTIAMAAARINHMAIACADRIGVERGQPWTGGTTIVDADGWVAGENRRPGPLYADVDLTVARDKRFTELADSFADRRPELYGDVVAPVVG